MYSKTNGQLLLRCQADNYWKQNHNPEQGFPFCRGDTAPKQASFSFPVPKPAQGSSNITRFFNTSLAAAIKYRGTYSSNTRDKTPATPRQVPREKTGNESRAKIRGKA